MAEIKVGGVWLASVGNVAATKWATRWGTGPCGPDLASCTLAVDAAFDASLLRLGQTFEVFADDGTLAFGGPLSEMDRDYPRTLHAKGWARRASDFDAVDGSGNPTMNPRTAVTQAIARGLPWTNPNVFPNVALGDAPVTPIRVAALLDQCGVTEGKRWGTDAYGVAFFDADPTVPTLYLDASSLDIGVATDGLFTRVRATYVSSVDGVTGEADGWDVEVADDTAGQALYGVIEYELPLAPLGLLSAPTAADYAQAQLDLLTVPQWLSRVEADSTRLLTPGGHGAHLQSVRYGQMVRLFDVPHSLGGLRGELGLDVVLGEIQHDDENPTRLPIAPVGLAVRNVVDFVARVA